MTGSVIVTMMTEALARPHVLSLAAGFTDTASLPADAVREAVAGVLAGPEGKTVLQYGSNQGRAVLRDAVAARTAGLDGGGATPEAADVFLTNGSQQALHLAMQTLCDPGDIILVESPTYFVFLEILQGLGVRAVSLPVDAAGRLDPEGVATLLAGLRRRGEAERVKAVYLVSYFSNPSGNSLGEEEKIALAETLRRAGFHCPVIEDAAYRELYYKTPHPARSVFALEAWADFPKLYLGTFTKPFASGLKVGYGICDTPDWLARMLCFKGHQDFGTAHFNQALIEQALAAGSFDSHLSRQRERYREKMETLDTALREGGLDGLGWEWSRPTGGLYLWAKSPAGVSTAMGGDFYRQCLDEGVFYVPGELCFGEGAPAGDWVRLSFGVLEAEQLREAAARFCRAATALATPA